VIPELPAIRRDAQERIQNLLDELIRNGAARSSPICAAASLPGIRNGRGHLCRRSPKRKWI